VTPLIGVTAGVEPGVRWRGWEAAAAVLPASYLRMVARPGGRSVLLPPDDTGAGETVAALDGLVVSGGGDIDPACYGAEAHPETSGVRPERDRAELALLREALARGLPVLGICRGAQLLVVAHGGDLRQHLPEVVGHDGHRPASGSFGWHDVRLAPGSRTASILGGAVKVASYHHQGIAGLGGGLRAVGWAGDGGVEAVESADGARFVVGVLWHPEHDNDERLFSALVEAARARRVTLG
jgi:gamma-glutamyl-gamma-aminobutyrate hydrolase PuuD